MQYSCHGKKRKVLFISLYFTFLNMRHCCNLIKLVNILRKYAAKEQKRF